MKLSFEHISKLYGNTAALQQIDLTLGSGVYGLLGPNGAGKTTLVKLLKGLLKPVSGNVYYGGEDIAGKTVAMLAGEVGYVFQNPDDQIFKYHVIDEVMFGPLNIGMSAEEAKKHAVAALTEVGLEKLVNENPYDLELSERKLLSLIHI